MIQKSFFQDWHSIRKEPGIMKWKFTYKELTLLIGILVAVIIMITLWFKPFGITSAEVLIKPAKHVAAPAIKVAIEQTTFFVNNLLH
ncbi:MAG: hypothetical protein JNJ75_15595 [Cyclobacteriaceae bacterium]|nr:hypothetical protein [Cyclobacteriaceae bacterium]